MIGDEFWYAIGQIDPEKLEDDRLPTIRRVHLAMPPARGWRLGAAQVKEAARKYFGTANRTILHIKPATKATDGKQMNR